ncbi:ABC transporter substrate-binding protein [Clostridium sp. DSM 100503]|uniref:ABC transporter substrate-binding protein n=1 Tax=Clostridium sp. DSM 100503 TaxID=2963282 RepID=UPI00214A743E|nr:ABC transporter substrate-binding protein [Clostridium sp. DSM 100503]MCR1951121.1 ABC transporter substrate-binding protein [Clostridium sp. DSM 100503]
MKNKKIKISIMVIMAIITTFFGVKIIKEDKAEGNILKNENKELAGEITFVSNRIDKKEELKTLISEFEEEHPKVKVNLELIGDAEEILQRRAMVQELPDVTLIPSAIKASEYSQFFFDLDDLGFTEDNIYNYSTGIGSDGKLYNLTTSISWNGIIYNKSVFKKLNINELPKTNEEFLNLCKAIKDNKIIPIALNYKQVWTMNTWIDVAPYLFDVKLEKNIILNNEDILSDNSGIFRALNFVRNIYQNNYCEDNLLNYEWEQSKVDIKNGKVAMIFWNSDFKYQLEDIGMNMDDIGMFPLPDSKYIKVYGDYKIGVAKNTKYPELSKAFLKFLFEEDRYANAVNILSPLKENLRNRDLIKELEAYNIPIDIHGDTIKNQTEEDRKIREWYETLRRLSGLDYSFVQEYITSSDIENLRDQMNNKWNELERKSESND